MVDMETKESNESSLEDTKMNTPAYITKVDDKKMNFNNLKENLPFSLVEARHQKARTG